MMIVIGILLFLSGLQVQRYGREALLKEYEKHNPHTARELKRADLQFKIWANKEYLKK